jgi:hypothetical protein
MSYWRSHVCDSVLCHVSMCQQVSVYSSTVASSVAHDPKHRQKSC